MRIAANSTRVFFLNFSVSLDILKCPGSELYGFIPLYLWYFLSKGCVCFSYL